MSLGPVIDFSDAAIFAMSLGNVLGLYLLDGNREKGSERLSGANKIWRDPAL
jgi:hypothetical protein